mmetsp:Transcript_5787/g.9143  ORF Transcript_5787/g.9143 Transcript_5787/m.9143 type:complete len:104 (+) Transcript_5787:201-512(+)
MDDAAKKLEIENFFKQQMETSKKTWEMRGKEARIAAHQARQSVKTWRNMKGMELMIHEAGHAGNRPFVMGLAVIAGFAFYTQASLGEDAKKDSDYWQAFHAKH